MRRPDVVRLLFGGDVMLGRGVGDVIRREGPLYPVEPLASLGCSVDLFLVNLECALSARQIRYSGPPKAFYFRGELAAVETLAAAGVDLVTLANNHALDADVEGLRDTLHILDANGITHVGAGANEAAASRPACLGAGGQRLGVVAWCDHQEDFAAGPTLPGVRYVDIRDPAMTAALLRDVGMLSTQVDHVVVSCHWQHNWVPAIGQEYRALARALVEAGARIVWGHSPHHFQGVEWINGSTVLYSTGDLLNDYAVNPAFRNDRQLLFELALDSAGVRAVRAFPIELDFGRTRPAPPDASNWIERRFQEACRTVGTRVERDGDWLRARAWEAAPVEAGYEKASRWPVESG